MSKLPKVLPDIHITFSDQPVFEVTAREAPAHFIIPEPGESCEWAIYDYPARTRSEITLAQAAARASVHGAEGVEIVCREWTADGRETPPRTLVIQQSGGYFRFLSETRTQDGVRRTTTFLDEDFLANWGIGEDNCGVSARIVPTGTIRRENGALVCGRKSARDITGRCTLTLGGRQFDTVLVTEIHSQGILTESYLDAAGRTVLWRRYNRDDWNAAQYEKRWSERLTQNTTLTVDGMTYVHWYDCISEYVL